MKEHLCKSSDFGNLKVGLLRVAGLCRVMFLELFYLGFLRLLGFMTSSGLLKLKLSCACSSSVL